MVVTISHHCVNGSPSQRTGTILFEHCISTLLDTHSPLTKYSLSKNCMASFRFTAHTAILSGTQGVVYVSAAPAVHCHRPQLLSGFLSTIQLCFFSCRTSAMQHSELLASHPAHSSINQLLLRGLPMLTPATSFQQHGT